MLIPLVQELAGKSAATVVVGSSAGSGVGSPIAVLRSNSVSSRVSTVDDADLTAGQTVAMQALAVELAGRQGRQLRVHRQRRERYRAEPRAHAERLRERDTQLPDDLDDEEEGQQMRRAGYAAAARALRGGRGQDRLLRHEPASAGRSESLVTNQPPGRAVTRPRGPPCRRGHRRVPAQGVQAGLASASGSLGSPGRRRAAAVVLGGAGAAGFGADDDLAGSGGPARLPRPPRRAAARRGDHRRGEAGRYRRHRHPQRGAGRVRPRT